MTQQPVTLLLDISISSMPLQHIFRDQTDLHMKWVSELHMLHDSRLPFLPIEYCSNPLRHVRRAEDNIPMKSCVYFNNESDNPLFIFHRNGCGDHFCSCYIGKKTLEIEPQETINEEEESEIITQECKKVRIDSDIEIPEVPFEVRDNKELMMNLVSENGMALYFAHPSLLFDEELVLKAIKNNAKAFTYIQRSLQLQDKFVEKALTVNGDCFEYIQPSLRGNLNFLKLALNTSAKAITFASNKLKNDINTIISSIYLNWKVIEFVDKQTVYKHYSYSVIMKKILQTVDAQELVGHDLIFSIEDVLTFLEISYKAFVVAKYECTLNENVIISALKKDIIVANYMTPAHLEIIRDNPQFDSFVRQMLDEPAVNLFNLGEPIIKYTSLENRIPLVQKYPELAQRIVEVEHLLNPFILMHIPLEKQVAIMEASLVNNLYFVKRNGYLTKEPMYSYRIPIFKILSERFKILYPGLVFPRHRFIGALFGGFDFNRKNFKKMLNSWDTDVEIILQH